ncbi:MAG: ABC transporter permease [Clostridia bacterium]|nr:ABC transporter permease [Clostridia bacterium]MBR0444768.1 ABC transporter permease [Clostridia bacterium]
MLNEILGAVALGLMWTLMTYGVYISYRVLDVADLTVEGSITMGAAISAAGIVAGIPPLVTLLFSVLGGMTAGMVTGILHTTLKIPALLSSILTMIALWSVNLHIMGKANVSLLKQPTVFDALLKLHLPKNLAVICIALLFVAGAFLILYWFFGTEIGCAIRATGNNERMARAQGINTDRMKILGLVIGNGFVALAGGLIAQSQSFADIQMGTGSIVIGLASLIIGEVLFGKKTFFNSLISLCLGSITYRVIIMLVLKLGMPANDLKLFTAITVALALALPTIKAKVNAKKTAKGGVTNA